MVLIVAHYFQIIVLSRPRSHTEIKYSARSGYRILKMGGGSHITVNATFSSSFEVWEVPQKGHGS